MAYVGSVRGNNVGAVRWRRRVMGREFQEDKKSEEIDDASILFAGRKNDDGVS